MAIAAAKDGFSAIVSDKYRGEEALSHRRQEPTAQNRMGARRPTRPILQGYQEADRLISCHSVDALAGARGKWMGATVSGISRR